MIIQFKNDQAQSDYGIMPAKLKEICNFFETCVSFYYITPVVTRVREGVCGDSGVHEAGRGIDYRDQEVMSDGSSRSLFTADQVQAICQQVADAYPRDDGKSVILHHSFNGGPMHFHIQIPFGWLAQGEPLPR
jgi:hypothetical protein